MSKELFKSTVWKIEDFPVIQNLREINYSEVEIAKTAILVILGL